MKQRVPVFAFLLGLCWVPCPALEKPLTTLGAIHALTNAEASRQIPVVFEATVTYYRNDDTDLFVQDKGDAIYVNYKAGAGLAAGDRVLVTGKTHDGFRPMINAESVQLLHHGMPPLLLVAGGLVVIVCVFAARGLALERKVRREAAIWATVERWRSGVLEDINRARPIAEIIVKITGLLSFKLHGAPCWCQLASGETLGNCPPDRTAARLLVIQHEIPSHSGAALGTIFAGINPRSKARATGPEALFNAAQLAALAIETGGLYSDLVHRSEFDLLTDIHNRFSLEKRLDKLLESERRQDATFGLIYIDLDDFKQVNDRCGHRVGDLYLQEVAQRMKRQLRPGDMLARLGGDEFAIVVSALHSRIDVEEITYRLERCFDDPFELEGNSLRGTASMGIAVYPEDGATRDTLLEAADAAMYQSKHARQQASEATDKERA